jgi:pyruvate formate lyase activating enzyme
MRMDNNFEPLAIASLQPVTLSDFPGKVAALIFMQGCNFRCSYCHNRSLLNTDKKITIDKEDVLAFLQRRRGKLQGVVVSGGEPTMQRRLIPFLREIKSMDYAVKLDTNGSYPDVLQKLLEENLVDYIAMDIKAPLKDYRRVVGQYVDTSSILRSIDLIMSTPELEYEFRTTALKSQLSQNDLLDCGALIRGATKYFLQACGPVNSAEWKPTKGEKVEYFSAIELMELSKRLSDKGLDCSLR